MRFLFMGGFFFIIQIFLAVHAARRGRNSWIFLIMFFPLVGSLVYVISYMIPDMQRSEKVQDTGEKIIRKIAPTRELLRLKKQLEFTDSVSNRQALADEYMKIGDYGNAVALYESCKSGIYEDDPDMIMDLAKAYFYNKDYEKSKEFLLEIKTDKSDLRNRRVQMLLAAVFENLGETGPALEEYRSLADKVAGEEARCRYALLLKKTGDREGAQKAFESIIFHAKNSPRYYRRDQKKWIGIARENLAELQQPPRSESPSA